METVSRELEAREVAAGLQFPEGPIAMPDGSVVLVEMARGTLSRVDVASGAIEVVAECGGGPNGSAVGPDGQIYLCNNGAFFEWHTNDGTTFPGRASGDHAGGHLLYDAPDGRLFDSLAVDGDGWVCVGTLGLGGITAVAPDGSSAEHVPISDVLATNICFGGPGHGSDDHRIAYVTGSTLGHLYQLTWPRPGLGLPY